MNEGFDTIVRITPHPDGKHCGTCYYIRTVRVRAGCMQFLDPSYHLPTLLHRDPDNNGTLFRCQACLESEKDPISKRIELTQRLFSVLSRFLNHCPSRIEDEVYMEDKQVLEDIAYSMLDDARREADFLGSQYEEEYDPQEDGS